MPMSRLIYASTHEIDTGTKDILDILVQARKNNIMCGITGVLLYDTRFFMQWLEGDRDMVAAVLQHIFTDDRHSHPVILSYHEVDKREFTEWSMGYVNMQGVESSLIFKFFPSQEFDPYALSATGAIEFLKEISMFKTDLDLPPLDL